MAIKDSNVTINVKDLDQSISFYQSIGFQEKMRWGNHYAQVSAPGLIIGLHPSSDSPQSSGSGNVSIGFTTDDYDETKMLLAKLAIQVTERQEEGGQFIHFQDPNGTALYFIKPKW